jgi:hypothetical protein
MPEHWPAALSARLDALRNDPAVLSEFELNLRRQSQPNSARRSSTSVREGRSERLVGPALSAVLHGQRAQPHVHAGSTATQRTPRPAQLLDPPMCGTWADAIITRARGHSNRDALHLQDPADAILLRTRVKGLERGGPMTFAPPSETERILAASVLAASTPRERPDLNAQARIAADWQPSVSRRPSVDAAYWKGPAFDRSGRAAASAHSDRLLLTRHRVPFVDYQDQQARIDTTRRRDLLKELPLTPRSARGTRPADREAQATALRAHRAEMDALAADLDGVGVCARDAALERMLLSTSLSMHRRRGREGLVPRPCSPKMDTLHCE